jgi:FAD/FMN-containing dehydrogenase
LALTDPTVLELERGIKRVFDPQSLLNPFRLFDDRVEEHFFLAESLDT